MAAYLKILAFLRRALTPRQLCIVCLASVAALYAYGVRTYASAEDVMEIRIQMTSQSLFDTRVKQCEVLRMEKSGAAYVEKIDDLKRKYESLTGFAYVLAPCNEL